MNLAAKINTHFFISQFSSSESTWAHLGSLLRTSQGQNEAANRLGSYLLP